MTSGKISLDLDDFRPEPVKIDAESKAQIKEAADSAGFTGRHAVAKERQNPVPVVPEQGVSNEVKRRGRKRTTGRDVPFTVKLRRDTNNQIYELADQLECGAIAEVIEMGLQALMEKISRGEPIR
jgi:hypothetical protein